jgi:hypothetical protein
MTYDGGSTWGGETSGLPQPPSAASGGMSGLPQPPSAASGGTNGTAVAAMICGIGSLLCLFLFFFIITIPLAAILAVAAIVTGIIGLGAANRSGTGRGQAVTGIATGSVTLILGLLGVLGLMFLWAQFDFETNPLTDPDAWLQELEDRGIDLEDLEEGRVDPEDLLPPPDQ